MIGDLCMEVSIFFRASFIGNGITLHPLEAAGH